MACRTTRPSTSRRRSTTSTTPRTSGTPTRRSPATCSTRWHRQRGERRLVPHRHRRARPEGACARAEANGVTPQEWCDQLVETRLEAGARHARRRQRRLHPHHRGAAHATGCRSSGRRLYDKGEIYEGAYEGPYCVGCEEFKLPGELSTATGDVRRASKLCADPRPARSRCCPESNYFFKLSEYADRLLALYEAHPDVRPARSRRATRCSRSSSSGLQDLSISRSTFDWGIPVPWDADARPLRVDRRAAQLRDAPSGSATTTTRPSSSRRPGRPTCTWSARTSCGSTR